MASQIRYIMHHHTVTRQQRPQSYPQVVPRPGRRRTEHIFTHYPRCEFSTSISGPTMAKLAQVAYRTDVPIHIKFTLGATVAHVAYLAVNRPVIPRPIVQAADSPQDPGVAVGVAAVQ
jgi:hypothetical protein